MEGYKIKSDGLMHKWIGPIEITYNECLAGDEPPFQVQLGGIFETGCDEKEALNNLVFSIERMRDREDQIRAIVQSKFL